MLALLAEFESLVREAGDLARRCREDLTKEFKPDGSVVTNGDRAVEEFLRPRLQALIPATGVWGEEFGQDVEGEGGLWLVDPIDGTTNYSLGSPLWGVSVGLIRRGVLELGAVFLPDLGELVVSARGTGVSVNGQPMPPLSPGPIRPEDTFSIGDAAIRGFDPARWPGKLRCSGAFVIDGVFTATQRYRGLVGYRERLYDVAPCVLFGLELGAVVSYADGTAFACAELLHGRQIDKPWVVLPPESNFRFDP